MLVQVLVLLLAGLGLFYRTLGRGEGRPNLSKLGQYLPHDQQNDHQIVEDWHQNRHHGCCLLPPLYKYHQLDHLQEMLRQ